MPEEYGGKATLQMPKDGRWIVNAGKLKNGTERLCGFLPTKAEFTVRERERPSRPRRRVGVQIYSFHLNDGTRSWIIYKRYSECHALNNTVWPSPVEVANGRNSVCGPAVAIVPGSAVAIEVRYCAAQMARFSWKDA
jgi:hypothetical protein